MKYIVFSRYEGRTYIEDNEFLQMESAQAKMKEVLGEYVERFTGEELETVEDCWTTNHFHASSNINGKQFDIYIVSCEIDTKYLNVSLHNKDIYSMKEFDREQDAYFNMEETLIEYFENDLDLDYDEEEFKKTQRIDWNISTNYAWSRKCGDIFEIEILKV